MMKRTMGMKLNPPISNKKAPMSLNLLVSSVLTSVSMMNSLDR
jgi:hypothetical protein